jgi:hypothetical protein
MERTYLMSTVVRVVPLVTVVFAGALALAGCAAAASPQTAETVTETVTASAPDAPAPTVTVTVTDSATEDPGGMGGFDPQVIADCTTVVDSGFAQGLWDFAVLGEPARGTSEEDALVGMFTRVQDAVASDGYIAGLLIDIAGGWESDDTLMTEMENLFNACDGTGVALPNATDGTTNAG